MQILSNNPHRPVTAWLLSGCFLIFCMVIIGGITRLTGSGLSITEWKPIMGAIPPLNEHDWNNAFEKYKMIPQFQKVNYDFTLRDFKFIFFWEYLHRLVGRLIGIVFIIPFVYFLLKKKLDNKTIKRCVFLFLLGGLQGFIGWFMVKSGLVDRTSVDHIRLAIHLLAAFITFGFTLYFALELNDTDLNENEINGNKLIENEFNDTEFNKKEINKINSATDNNFKLLPWIHFLLTVIILQLIYGAFVAGMHAGKIYNTFPLMNGQFIPDGIFSDTPIWRNLFQNQITVQFMHRFFAGIVFILTCIIYFRSRKTQLTIRQSRGINYLIIMVLTQILLGIITLLTRVDIVVASLHQVGAFALFAVVVGLEWWGGEKLSIL